MEPGFAPSEIDTTRPHPARMYDYYLGGKDNYLVDQQAAREILRIVPEVRLMARENRAFLQRAVRFLVGEAGIRQIIDIGTGIPTVGNVHEVATETAPDVRVVYVDNDPIVHVHASALLTLIDLSQPVALLLIAILHFITDNKDPAGIVTAFRDALGPGTYLALSHGTSDFHSEDAVSRGRSVYERASAPLVLRSHAQIAAFFDGFDLVEPGLVQVPLWRPDTRPPRQKNLAKIGAAARSDPSGLVLISRTAPARSRCNQRRSRARVVTPSRFRRHSRLAAANAVSRAGRACPAGAPRRRWLARPS